MNGICHPVLRIIISHRFLICISRAWRSQWLPRTDGAFQHNSGSDEAYGAAPEFIRIPYFLYPVLPG